MEIDHGIVLVQLDTDVSDREMVEGNWHLPASVGDASELLTTQGACGPSPVGGWGERRKGQCVDPDWIPLVGSGRSPFLMIVLLFPKYF